MTPQEFFIVWEARRPKQRDEYQGTLSEADLEELHQMIHDED